SARRERDNARSALARVAAMVGDATGRALPGPQPPGTRVHIVAPFENAHAGTELHALEVASLLAPVADVTLWATQPDVPPALAERGVVPIAIGEGRFPTAGVIVVSGRR